MDQVRVGSYNADYWDLIQKIVVAKKLDAKPPAARAAYVTKLFRTAQSRLVTHKDPSGSPRVPMASIIHFLYQVLNNEVIV